MYPFVLVKWGWMATKRTRNESDGWCGVIVEGVSDLRKSSGTPRFTNCSMNYIDSR